MSWELLLGFMVLATAIDVAWRIIRSFRPKTIRITFTDPEQDKLVGSLEIRDVTETEIVDLVKKMTKVGYKVWGVEG